MIVRWHSNSTTLVQLIWIVRHHQRYGTDEAAVIEKTADAAASPMIEDIALDERLLQMVGINHILHHPRSVVGIDHHRRKTTIGKQTAVVVTANANESGTTDE